MAGSYFRITGCQKLYYKQLSLFDHVIFNHGEMHFESFFIIASL